MSQFRATSASANPVEFERPKDRASIRCPIFNDNPLSSAAALSPPTTLLARSADGENKDLFT